MSGPPGSVSVAGRMRPRVLRLLIVPAIAVSAPAWATGTQRRVHLRGTAYEFNNVHVLLAGATIRVAEFPRLEAVVHRDGTYDLAVPDRSRVTPYILAAGHHTIYLQTFTTDGENLANVNFQTPSDGVYRALVALLKVSVDSRGNLRQCAIVSTFNTRNVRDLSYAGFIAYGAHGVAGATATASPALPKPLYFNEGVLPDPSQSASSKDGGVVWTGVPPGVYTITAHDPATRFASFVATCRPGRVVNANPPWGLHQLGRPNPARVSASWSVRGSHTSIRSLSASKLPAGAVIMVRCSGPGCPLRSRTLRPSGTTFDIRRAIGNPHLTNPDTLAVTVSAHAFNGLVVSWAIAGGRQPSRTTLCVPLGYVTPRPRCASS